MNDPVSTNNYAQLVTIATREDDASEIESFLRESGLPVRMTWLKPGDDLSDSLKAAKPDIAFCDAKVLELNPEALQVCTRALPYTPLLLLTESIHIEMVTKVMQQRARDVVSVNQPDHLRAVYMRELGVCRLLQQLNHAQNEVDALEERLEGLIKSSEAAVVNVQEGIIVDANPRFATMFGYESHEQAVGLPFMDQVHPDSQDNIKKIMSRCAKGRVMSAKAEIKAVTSAGSDFAADTEIKLVQFEGEPAIEFQIKSEAVVAAPEVDMAVEETKVSPRDKLVKDTDNRSLDQRGLLYRSLENPKHYPPEGSGLSLGYIIADDSARIKQQLGLANAEHFLGRIPQFLNKQFPGVKCYRLSSEEFVLLAPGKLFKHGESLSRKFCKQIAGEIFDYEGKSVVLTLSIAITLIDKAQNSGVRFAEARDDARKLSSSGGNGIAVCASARTTEQTAEPIHWEHLEHALAKNRIRLATRPIASLEGDGRHYYEVEPRIPGDKGTLVSIEGGGPQDTFTSLQVELDRKVIMLAMGMLKKADDGGEEAGIIIPISSCFIEDAKNTLPWLKEQHQKLGLKNQQVVLSLSEGVLTPHVHRLKDLIGKLEDQPFKFAIAECSGNEQSVRLIQNLPAHFLRLTASATRGLCDSKSSKSEGLHEAVSIAREQGYKIIAAATGDAHSMAVLWQLGVNYVESAEMNEPAAA